MSTQNFHIKEYEINTYQNAKAIQERLDALFVAAELLNIELETGIIEDYFHRQIMIAAEDIPILNVTVDKTTNLLVGFVIQDNEIYDELDVYEVYNENTIRAYLPDQFISALTLIAKNL